MKIFAKKKIRSKSRRLVYPFFSLHITSHHSCLSIGIRNSHQIFAILIFPFFVLYNVLFLIRLFLYASQTYSTKLISIYMEQSHMYCSSNEWKNLDGFLMKCICMTFPVRQRLIKYLLRDQRGLAIISEILSIVKNFYLFFRLVLTHIELCNIAILYTTTDLRDGNNILGGKNAFLHIKKRERQQ